MVRRPLSLGPVPGVLDRCSAVLFGGDRPKTPGAQLCRPCNNTEFYVMYLHHLWQRSEEQGSALLGEATHKAAKTG